MLIIIILVLLPKIILILFLAELTLSWSFPLLVLLIWAILLIPTILLILKYEKSPTLAEYTSSGILGVFLPIMAIIVMTPLYILTYGWEDLGGIVISSFGKDEIIINVITFNSIQFIILIFTISWMIWVIKVTVPSLSEEISTRYIGKKRLISSVPLTLMFLSHWFISAVAIWLLIFHALNFILVALLHQRPIFPDILSSSDYWSHISAFVEFISSIKHQRYDIYLLTYLAMLMSFLPFIFLISLTAVGVGRSIVERIRKGEKAPDWIVEIVKEASKVANIEMSDIYVVDKDVLNAESYSYGLFRLKHRIILTSKLINVMSDEEELKAVIYHEIYHLKHNTRLKNLLTLISTITLTGRGVLNAIFDFSSEEYLADEFAAKHTSPEIVLSMLQKLACPDLSRNEYSGMGLWSKFKFRVAESSLAKFCQLWMKELPTYMSPTIADRVENIRQLISESSQA